MSTQTLAWRAAPTATSGTPAHQRVNSTATPVWLTHGLLALASTVLLMLACASAWLSYHAQVAYVVAHNGGGLTQARVWALLLDAGTAGVSLLRLYETLQQRAGGATRASLLGCIAASVTLNLLHAPSRTAGGYLVAAIPPVMYAVFLEHLLTNLRSLLTAEQKRRRPLRALALWINFPALMWSAQRDALRREAEGASAAVEVRATSAAPDGPVPISRAAGAQHHDEAVDDAYAAPPRQRPVRRGRGLGAKRIAFEAALAAQVQSGDLRVFSASERERNAAAYQAAASLPVPLSRGAARRYVVQALSRVANRCPDQRPAVSGPSEAG